MKTARLLRWSGSVLSPRMRPEVFRQSTTTTTTTCTSIPRTISRSQATAAATPVDHVEEIDEASSQSLPEIVPEEVLTKLPSPPVTASRTSAKLAALHARLRLPSRLPVETLARTLVDSSADRNPKFNNAAFAVLGSDLLGHYTSEYIICQFPRLPLAVVFAAMSAYVGPKALASITREWGVQAAAFPGGEVDPGFLQFKHLPPGEKQDLPDLRADLVSTHPVAQHGSQGQKWRHSISSRTIHDNEFGDVRENYEQLQKDALEGVTLSTASAKFVRALVGAVYLHAGRSAAKSFYKDHFMSRQLNMASLIQFRTPTKDLSRLCAREGFESPVARILSETGRLSRHPVFIVGVFSGREKLGEGAGSSLDEARTRAAVAALKGWYLYSPLDWRLPSDAEESGSRAWDSQFVDVGDVVI